jgi:hypothetical protein
VKHGPATIERMFGASRKFGRRVGRDLAHDLTSERQARDSQPVRVRSEETPRSSVVKPPGSVEMPGPKRGGPTRRSATSSEVCSVEMFACICRAKREPSLSNMGEGHGRHSCTWSGCSRTLRRKGTWNGEKGVVGTGETLLGPGPAGIRSAPAYNRRREVAGSREGVGGGRSSDDGQDNTTCSERRTPTSSMHEERVEEAGQ